MKTKTLNLVPRSPQRTRFQTAVSGLTWVPTVMNAHFDPYEEPPASPSHSKAEMEAVPRIEINGANQHSPAQS